MAEEGLKLTDSGFWGDRQSVAEYLATIRCQAQIAALRWALPYVRAANRHDVFEGLLRLEAGGQLEEEPVP